jgi:DNA-binding SARP family transcriptional activator
MGQRMGIRILGPLRVWDGAQWAPVHGPQQRIMLSVLAAEFGRLVAKDRLIHDIWGERPIRTARSAVNGYAMRLRRLLQAGGAANLITRAAGYELVADAGALDAKVFESHVDRGKRCAEAGRLAEAAQHLSDGLALWRGTALADVPATPIVSAEATRLEQLRLSALEERIGAELDLGLHAQVVDELSQLVQDHPLRERLCGYFMIALYRCGRRAEALGAYRGVRTVLVEETGIEPGPELRALERAVLNDGATLAVPTDPTVATAPVPAQLPALVPDFAGREVHLRRLDALLADRAPAIITIDGLAGVGKTALAVRWAHSAGDRFPDGHLFIDMRGYSDQAPVQPLEALARFLQALGVAPEHIPLEVDAAACLYRSTLAGKRVLVVLDNVEHADQVRPLLPGETGCLSVVTSRDQLRGLIAREGAMRLRLDVLSPAEAHELLVTLLGRVDAAAAAELARLCGYLPLALRIAVANLQAEQVPVAQYNKRLANGDRLAALAAGDDPQAATANAFDLSYQAQSDSTRKLFRLLGIVPGADVTPETAAAVTDVDPEQADALLATLARAHLLEQVEPDRYRFHELVRLYARQRCLAEDGDRDVALARLYEHYLSGVDAAANRLYPMAMRLPVTVRDTHRPDFDSGDRALQWLDAQRFNLAMAITLASPPHREAAWRLTDALRGYFFLSMHTADWLPIAQAALAHAEADQDLLGQAAASISLAMVWWYKSRYEIAIDSFTHAYALARDAAWAEGQAAALGNLGSIHVYMGQFTKAAEYILEAFEIDRRIGRIPGQVVSLTILGDIRVGQGRLVEAVDAYRQAIDVESQIGPWYGQGGILHNLGEVYYLLGRPDDALYCLTESLNRYRGGKYFRASVLRLLALVHADSGDLARGFAVVREALDLARESGDRWVESQALISQAKLDLQIGHHRQAIDASATALRLAREAGARLNEANALICLARGHVCAGELSGASGRAEEALEMSRALGYRLYEGHALAVLAAVSAAKGENERSQEYQALADVIFVETNHRPSRTVRAGGTGGTGRTG